MTTSPETKPWFSTCSVLFSESERSLDVSMDLIVKSGTVPCGADSAETTMLPPACTIGVAM